jgi:hypothetical protein
VSSSIVRFMLHAYCFLSSNPELIVTKEMKFLTASKPVF